MPVYASIMVWCMNTRRCYLREAGEKRGWREERLERKAHGTGPGLTCSSFELLHRYEDFFARSIDYPPKLLFLKKCPPLS
eukprot:21917_4